MLTPVNLKMISRIHNRVKQTAAVIAAAGKGIRLGLGSKPTLVIGGLSHYQRSLHALYLLGIRDVFVLCKKNMPQMSVPDLYDWYTPMMHEMLQEGRWSKLVILQVISRLLGERIVQEPALQDAFFRHPQLDVYLPNLPVFPLPEGAFAPLLDETDSFEKISARLVTIRLKEKEQQCGMPFTVVAIGGGAGSGKSTGAEKLKEELELQGWRTQILATVCYLKPREQRYKNNIKGLETYNWNRLNADMRAITDRQDFSPPLYDPVTGTIGRGGVVSPKNLDVLILEGPFTLYHNNIYELADVKIFFGESGKNRYFLRESQETIDKQRDMVESIWLYMNIELNEYSGFIHSSAGRADLVVYILQGCMIGRIVSALP